MLGHWGTLGYWTNWLIASDQRDVATLVVLAGLLASAFLFLVSCSRDFFKPASGAPWLVDRCRLLRLLRLPVYSSSTLLPRDA
jgi:hypothetical protein